LRPRQIQPDGFVGPREFDEEPEDRVARDVQDEQLPRPHDAVAQPQQHGERGRLKTDLVEE
jgi:hypothetical protein